MEALALLTNIVVTEICGRRRTDKQFQYEVPPPHGIMRGLPKRWAMVPLWEVGG